MFYLLILQVSASKGKNVAFCILNGCMFALLVNEH